MTSGYTEGERRLRAIVRACVSPGVWLVVGAQLLVQFVMRQGQSADGAAVDVVWVLALAALIMAFVYLQAGTYQALAHSAGRLTLRDTIGAGMALFTRFLWLFIKLGLLAALVFNLFALLLLAGAGLSLESLVRTLAPILPLLLAVLGFAFVYWLPLVFVSGDFRLLASLNRALRVAWQRLPQSGFLALMILAPVVLLSLWSAVAPDNANEVARAAPGVAIEILLLSASLVASLFGWIAYIYCAEWLREQSPAEPSTTR